MAQFQLIFERGGHVARRVIDAESAQAARLALGAGERLLALKPLTGRTGARWGLRRRGTAFPLMRFSRELVSLLEAGLNTAESLGILRDKADTPTLRAALSAIEAQLAEGRTLSAALAAQPQHFSALYVAVVSSSEQTGQLAHALCRFLEHEGRLAALKQQLIGALLYPLLVLAVGMLVVVFMLFYVIPRFAALLASSTQTLSFSAELMLGWSRLVQEHGALVMLGMGGLGAVVLATLAHPPARAGALNALCRLPKVGAYRQLFELTRFYSALGLVLDGGVPMPEALRLVGSLLGPTRALGLARAQADLAAGLPLSSALKQGGLTTVVAEHLLRIGEHTGELGRMCAHIVLFQDDALARAHEVVTKVFGPLIMLAVGVMVGGLVVMLYMPIFELAGGLGA